MSALVIPFAREPLSYRNSEGSRGTSPSARPPLALGDTLHPDLEALADSHADDLRMGSVAEAVFELFGVARDARNNRPHVPAGIIAAAVVELLAPVLVELETVIAREARRGAVREAHELDHEFAEMEPGEQAREIGFLTPAQRSALIWAQARAMPPHGAA